jgi:hypothetical protein
LFESVAWQFEQCTQFDPAPDTLEMVVEAEFRTCTQRAIGWLVPPVVEVTVMAQVLTPPPQLTLAFIWVTLVQFACASPATSNNEMANENRFIMGLSTAL